MALITVTSNGAWLGANPPGAWLQLLTSDHKIIASMLVDELASKQYTFTNVTGEVAALRVISGGTTFIERVGRRVVCAGESIVLEIRSELG